MQWKIKYNKIIIAISIFSFAFGAVYNLAPFFYSKNFLIKKTKEDLSIFLKTNKVLKDSRFSFLKKENNGVSCAYSKYLTFAVCKEGDVK